MGILQNILKTINTAIDNIDFSPYQLISNKSTDGTLADNSDTKYSSQKATKTYIDNQVSSLDGRLDTAENNISTLQSNVFINTSDISSLNSNKANTSDVNTALGLKQDTLGYTAENQANKNTAHGYLGANSNGYLDADKVDLVKVERIFDDFIKIDTGFNSGGLSANGFWNRAGTTATTVTQSSVTDVISGFSDKLKNIVRVGITDSTNAYGTLYCLLNKHIGNTNIIEVETYLSSYSNNGELWFGFGSAYPNIYNQANNTIAQAIFIKHKTSENASFTTNVCISSSNTQVDSNVDKLANTPYTLKIRINKNNNTIYFYINNNLVDTRVVDSLFLQPVSSGDTPFIYFFISQTGDSTTTNRFIVIDYVDIKETKVSR